MDDHLVQIGQSHLFQGLVDGAGGLLIGLVLGGHLAGHEELLPGEPAGADTLSHAPLVARGLGGVDEPVAQLHRLAHGFGGLGIVDEPGPQTQLGDGQPFREGIAFLQHHVRFPLTACGILRR